MHWDSQCVFEIFMYFEMYFLMNNQFPLKYCVFQNIANVFLKHSDFQNLKNFKNALRLEIFCSLQITMSPCDRYVYNSGYKAKSVSMHFKKYFYI